MRKAKRNVADGGEGGLKHPISRNVGKEAKSQPEQFT